MKLRETDAYFARGLSEAAQGCLALFGDLLLSSEFNVTGIKEPAGIERVHFLDSLSLLDLECVCLARDIVDIGSGAGIPALVLALALPEARIVAVESRQKMCDQIERAVQAMSLANVEIRCVRVEEYGQIDGREAYDVALSRALATLPAVTEYSLPLLRVGGAMVAMKGVISDEECTHTSRALGILGGGSLECLRLMPFTDAENLCAYVAIKTQATPPAYPRRPGMPTKRPLGS